jgi:hypothetical protein
MPPSEIRYRVTLVRTDVSEENIALHRRGIKNQQARKTLAVTEKFLVTANVFPSSVFLSTLMTEGIHSSETSVLTRATQHYIPEGGILHSHRRENLKSYIIIFLHTDKCILSRLNLISCVFSH